MNISNNEMARGDNGFYDSHVLHRLSGGAPEKSPDIFLDWLEKSNTSYAEHIERRFGSRPGTFFSRWLSILYSSWVSEDFFNSVIKAIEEGFYAEASRKIIEGSEVADIKNAAYLEGIQEGRAREVEARASLPNHPLQKKSISSCLLWDVVVGNSQKPYPEFISYVLLAAQSYRDFGRESLLSDYDWESECYWMTPELAFFSLTYFPIGSTERSKGLAYLFEKHGVSLWASNVHV